MTYFTQAASDRDTWTGRAAKQAAQRMAWAGETGIVVDVRFPPLFPRDRSLARRWRSVRVDVGSESRDFFPAGNKRSPFTVPLAPGPHRVAAINEELERLEQDVVVESPGVTVVAIRPSYVWLLLVKTKPRIEVVEVVRA